jgi:hypothetical protein
MFRFLSSPSQLRLADILWLADIGCVPGNDLCIRCCEHGEDSAYCYQRLAAWPSLILIRTFLRPLLCARCGKQLHECACEDVAVRSR